MYVVIIIVYLPKVGIKLSSELIEAAFAQEIKVQQNKVWL